MIRRARALAVGYLLAVAACAPVEPDEMNLRDSFVSQITAVDGVVDVARNGDELTFSGPDDTGRTASWRVRIESAVLKPGPGGETQGHIVSSWLRDGEEVVFLGTMSAIPRVYLDTGVAHECYAVWDPAASTWGWT
ncbi:MAG: hypothetical protein QF681_16610 [Vicinamibacterales bacterium]|jgi:hypothetical protein|nr:hypothetical protein [Vicinamibacterales bacterium]